MAATITKAGLAVAALLAAAVGAPMARAQQACAAAVSVYFPETASQPTREAAAVLDRTGRDLAACRPERISVLAQFSPAGGKAALDVALARLAQVADALIQAGVDASRLRMAAMPAPGPDGARGPGRVDVWSGEAQTSPRTFQVSPEGAET